MLLDLLRLFGRLVVGAVLAILFLFVAMLASFFGPSGRSLLGMLPFVAIFAVIWAVSPVAWKLIRSGDTAAKIPPNYPWRCQVCNAPNLPGLGECLECGHPANSTATEIEAAKSALERQSREQTDA